MATVTRLFNFRVDEDLLAAARQRARSERTTLTKVLTNELRRYAYGERDHICEFACVCGRRLADEDQRAGNGDGDRGWRGR